MPQLEHHLRLQRAAALQGDARRLHAEHGRCTLHARQLALLVGQQQNVALAFERALRHKARLLRLVRAEAL